MYKNTTDVMTILVWSAECLCDHSCANWTMLQLDMPQTYTINYFKKNKDTLCVTGCISIFIQPLVSENLLKKTRD